MILVVGSTGGLGTEICRRLAARDEEVRALARITSNPEKVEALYQLGADVVFGDLRDPASLQAACRDVDVVISTASAMPFAYVPRENDIGSVDLAGELSLLAAAAQNGVERVIYTSFSGNIEGSFPLCHAKRTLEDALRDSGLAYTILRPSFFMEVWLTAAVGFDAANGKARIFGTGDQRISWISRNDVAAYAAEAVANPAARNVTLELGGPEALSPHEVVARFEAAARRTFEVTHVPVESLEAQLREAADPMQRSFLGLMLCYAQGDPIGGMEETAHRLSVRMTSLDVHIHHVVPVVA